MDVPVVPPLVPPAAGRPNPTVASASARKRDPNCIRVLPLWLFLQPSSRIAAAMRGESAPDAGLTHTASAATMNSVGRARIVSSHQAVRSHERPFDVSGRSVTGDVDLAWKQLARPVVDRGGREAVDV